MEKVAAERKPRIYAVERGSESIKKKVCNKPLLVFHYERESDLAFQIRVYPRASAADSLAGNQITQAIRSSFNAMKPSCS